MTAAANLVPVEGYPSRIFSRNSGYVPSDVCALAQILDGCLEHLWPLQRNLENIAAYFPLISVLISRRNEEIGFNANKGETQALTIRKASEGKSRRRELKDWERRARYGDASHEDADGIAAGNSRQESHTVSPVSLIVDSEA